MTNAKHIYGHGKKTDPRVSRCVMETLETRRMLATVSVDIGPTFQAGQPGWKTWSATSGNSSTPLALAGGGGTTTVSVSGAALSWVDYSTSKNVTGTYQLAYRDGVNQDGNLTISFANLPTGTYSMILSSVDYGTAGSAGSPYVNTFDIRVTDLTRTNIAVATGKHTATAFSVAQADLTSFSFSPKADKTATIVLTRTSATGKIWLNGFRLDDGVTLTDTTAPSTPIWGTAPYAVQAGVAGATMIAAASTDASGVEYYFENIGAPSRNSGWIATPSWTDLGLAGNTSYSYHFKVRDQSTAHNTTGWSSTLAVTTASDNTFVGFTTTDIGTRRPTFDFTGIRAIPHAPAVGVHPRIFTSPEELPDLRNRYATTVSGQEAMAEIHAYTQDLTLGNAGYVRTAGYAVDAWNNARLNNVGYYDVSAFYNGLVNYDWNANPLPANPLPFTTGGAYDGGARQKLASMMALAAFECWIYRGQAEYDARALDLAKAMDTWYRLIQSDTSFNSSNYNIFGGSHMAEMYDFNYDMMTTAQRDNVRAGIITITWPQATNYGVTSEPYATTSNWAVLNDFIPIQLMAVEGETGAFPSSYMREFMRIQYNFLTYGWYSDTGAPNEGLGKNYQGLATMAAFSRRDYNLVGHPAVRAFITNYLPKIMQPYGNAFSEYDDWGGSGRDQVTGNYKFASEDAVGGKYLFSNDATADFVLQNYMGVAGNSNPYAAYFYANAIGLKPFGPNNYVNNLIPGAISAMDFNAANLQSANWQSANTAAQKNNDAFFEPSRGLVISRSAFDSNAMQMQFQSRQDLGGHTHADRNNFTLSALGRMWGIMRSESSTTGPSGNVLSESQYHNTILVDGIGMAINAQDVSKQPGKIVSFTDTNAATFAAGDAKYAYDWLWNGHLGGGLLETPFVTAVDESLNNFRMNKSSESWYDERLYNRAFWNGGGDDENFTKVPYNPMLKAFRTTGLVRGTHPYALIMDDYQKDYTAHTYKWLMQLPDDLSVDSTVISSNPANYRNDLILKETTGNRRLLVRVIQNDGQTDPNIPAYIDPFLDPRYETSTWLRLAIDSTAVSPNFKVMLFPYTVGDALPVTALGSGQFTNTLDGRTDTVNFTSGADGRTRYSLSQNSVVVNSDTGDTAPAAPSNLTFAVQSQTRIDLNWTINSTNEQRFVIERSTDGTNFTQVNSVLSGISTFADMSVSPGTTYFYRVRSANALQSAASNTVTATAWPAGMVLVQVGQRDYAQNFNLLTSSTVQNVNWAGDTWLPGWYLLRGDTSQLRFDNGTQTFPRPFSMGSADNTQTNSLVDRGLGGMAAGNGYHAQGVLFKNTTGFTLTKVAVNFRDEQWRKNVNAGSIKFYYKLQAATPTFDLSSTSGWSTVSALDFNAATGTAASLDGNAAANSSSESTTLTLSIPDGQYLWLGWRIVGGSNSSNPTLAMDDLTVSFNGPPIVATPASATPNPVAGTTTSLSVLGADDGGESTLNYVWSILSKPVGATDPTFSINSSNAAKNTVATFSALGSYTFRCTITDAGGLSVTSDVNVTVQVQNPILTGSTAADIFYLKRSGTTFQLFNTDPASGSPINSWPTWSLNSLTFNAGNGNDVLILDHAGGNPVPAGGVVFNGEVGTDTVDVRGAVSSDAFTVTGSSITRSALSTTFATTETLKLTKGLFTLTANLAGLNLHVVGSNAKALFNTAQTIAALTLGSGASAQIAPGGNNTLVVTSLSMTAAQLDLTNNAFVLKSPGQLASAVSLIQAGQNGFDNNGLTAWNGLGIISSTAQSNNLSLGVDTYAVGAIRNGDLNDLFGTGSAYSLFKGVAVGNEDILVRYTYQGDANLDGDVNIDDYNAIDAAFLNLIPIRGWASGDFDFNNSLSIDDYNAIDTGFLYSLGSLGV